MTPTPKVTRQRREGLLVNAAKIAGIVGMVAATLYGLWLIGPMIDTSELPRGH